MKSLSRILLRYLWYSLWMLLITLALNMFLYVLFGFQTVQSTNRSTTAIRNISEELDRTDGTVCLSEQGYEYLKTDYVWAMLLDAHGTVLWNWNLPDSLNHSYTVSEVASFSKWYLDDYPVTEWVTDHGLLVIAQQRGSIWKYNIKERKEVLHYITAMIPVTLSSNLILLFCLVLVFGFRFYRSLRVLAVGLEQLSEEKEVHLPEKGPTELLAGQLNRTSDILTRQRKHLAKRDEARISWINGVSHDIRTPLSLIMGYAADLKEDASLSEEQQHLAEIIKAQSMKIKRLIEDLNLTSRLEYDMQPLRLSELHPAGLLRTAVSDFYNQGLSDRHLIDLYMDPDVEQITLNGDPSLLTRAFSNLIQNSIRHNPDGCTVTVTAYPEKDGICFQVSDDGCGIPKAVIQSLEGRLPETEKAPHIMGLRIVYQIFQAHGWQMLFTDSHTIHILGADCSRMETSDRTAHN